MVIPGGGCMNILLLGATGYLGGGEHCLPVV